jgi:hypothetical protein
MTGTKSRDYHDLERESSNYLLEHDSKRTLGRYEDAAYDALRAGTARARMGQLGFEAGEHAEAVEDWLSAVECFLQATAKKQGAEVLKILHRLEAEGKVPAERPDLHATLQERDQGLTDLNQRVQQFLREIGVQGHQVDRADEGTLCFLLEQVRSLPGLAMLHYAIFRQASDLGQQELAAKHLVWAATFDPDNANLVALLGYLHLTLDKPDRALALGNDFLATHSSETGPVRIMLANALGLGSGGRPPDQERALEVLRPLIESSDADGRERIAALALSATFHYELGREQEFGRLVQELDRLESSTKGPELRGTIADFREMIPHPEVNGSPQARPSPRRLLTEGDRWRLFQKAMQVSIRPMSLAACS